MLYYIKVNLPETEDDYINGDGEGVWVLVQEDAKIAYHADASEGSYLGILANDSIYYPHMKHGMAVVIEMRGERRPVVPWLFLVDYEAYVRSETK